MEKCNDIGDVHELDKEDDGGIVNVDNVEVIAIQQFNDYPVCLFCKGKVTALSDVIGTCSKCDKRQRIDKCLKELSAKMLMSNGQTLSAFGNIVKEIVGSDETVTEDALLCARSFSLKHNKYGVITTVHGLSY